MSQFDSLRVAAITLRQDRMDVQRYDVRNANGVFVQKFWRCLNEPILDNAGRVKFLLHTAVEVPAPQGSNSQIAMAGFNLAMKCEPWAA